MLHSGSEAGREIMGPATSTMATKPVKEKQNVSIPVSREAIGGLVSRALLAGQLKTGSRRTTR
jgi:hypothetical protein